MKIGMLINSDKYAGDVNGIAKAALAAGHEVIIFVMDEGINIMHDPSLLELTGSKGVSVSYCDHNAQQLKLDKSGLPGEIVSGSQYNNAVMANESDRLIVL
ncbi:MAG: DsrE family protein [Nitrospirota bacterium]|nr:MAG: DsrE family protein [Nitrospirota bacterium]